MIEIYSEVGAHGGKEDVGDIGMAVFRGTLVRFR